MEGRVGRLFDSPMPVRMFYVDESKDENSFCLSAIAIWHTDWKECHAQIREHRRSLKAEYGFLIRKEIHARDLVAGRGMICSKGDVVTKWERSRIFLGLLNLVAALPKVRVFNVCLPSKGNPDVELKAWDRLLNRIETSMRKYEEVEHELYARRLNAIRPKLDPEEIGFVEARLKRILFRAVIFADEGREREITRIMRKMRAINHIPSRYGAWASGDYTKNILAERIIEDPVFKPSHRCSFIQLADCVAFSLLKREVPTTPNIARYGIHKMFDQAIGPVCEAKACRTDPLGIVRG